jgi:hypothetical protein
MILPKVRILLLIALWGISFVVKAQIPSSFTVIKVSGKVVSKILNRQLKSGDIVKPEDRLVFDTKDAYVHVINAEGTKTIRNIPDNSPREFMQLMQTFLSPDSKNKATRGVENSSYEKIKSVLTEDTILVLGNGYISIDTTETSLRKPAGVKAKFSVNNEKVSLVVSNETGYHLGKEQLFFKSPGITTYPKVTVVYYEDLGDPIHKASVLLGSFTPLYIDEVELQKEVKIIIKSLNDSKLSNDHLFKEITNYLWSEYAAPIEENVKGWLDGNELLIKN